MTPVSLSLSGRAYVASVVVVGSVPIGMSLLQLRAGSTPDVWLLLAALTLFAGAFSIRVPSTGVTISFSEPLLLALALCFGPGPATLTVALDGLLASVRARRRNVCRILFNMTEPAISMWLSAGLFYLLADVEPMFGRPVELVPLLFPLLAMTTSYFALNALLSSAALWCEKGISLWRLLSENRTQVALNHLASFSLATVLVYNANSLSLATILVLIPLLVMSYVTSRAVGDRTETQVALRQSEARLRELAANINEVLWMAEVDTHRLLYLSPAYDRIWGRPGKAIRGRDTDWIQTVHGDDRERVRNTFDLKPPISEFDVEYRIERPDGSIRWIADRVFPVADHDGVVRRVAGVAEDITEQRKLEQQLLQSKKLEGIGRMAGGVAHDFNNVLMVILGRAGKLMTTLDETDPRRRNAQEIKSAAQKAAALTQQLLAFGRKQSLTMKVLDLNHIVRDVSQMLLRLIGENIHFEMRLGSSLGRITGDASQIEQMLVNLAVNARDAMTRGGTLTIETTNRSIDPAQAAEFGVSPGSYAMLAVTDDGVGMDEETRSRVFEPFFTTKGPGHGSGLGLATLYGTVQQLGGSVRVLSRVQSGTRFEIFLPQTEAPLSQTAQREPAPTRLPATETVLLIEDDEAVRTMVVDMLVGGGFQVLEADGPETALSIASRHDGPIDLVLTDFVMPGMNGRDLVARLKADRPQTKSLYMSGYSDATVYKAGSGLGRHDALISKPFTEETLLSRVRQVVGGRAATVGPLRFPRPDPDATAQPESGRRPRDQPGSHVPVG
ncbi:MAG: PAS domain-containing protein [Vicinamibacterales bacterium]|jgi:PAS domain S-box-containing protein|nr:PAS domain-containing protein [Vicinamibacterales bacterium]